MRISDLLQSSTPLRKTVATQQTPPPAKLKTAMGRPGGDDWWDDSKPSTPVVLSPEPAIGNSSYHYGETGYHPLFGTSDLANDVEQGQLGDCGPSAAISQIARQRPDLLWNALTQNADGTVTAKLYSRIDPNDASKGFELKSYTFDEKLPVDGNGNLAFGHTRAGDLFEPLLEKAMAIRSGGYQNIAGMSGADLMEAVCGTGAPNDTVMFQNDPRYLLTPGDGVAQVKAGLAQGQLITVATGDQSKCADGIVGAHWYSVEGVVEKNGKTYVAVRNPWGFHEPENKLLGVFSTGAKDGKDDGRFLISQEDFDKSFIMIAHVAPPELPTRGGGSGGGNRHNAVE